MDSLSPTLQLSHRRHEQLVNPFRLDDILLAVGNDVLNRLLVPLTSSLPDIWVEESLA